MRIAESMKNSLMYIGKIMTKKREGYNHNDTIPIDIWNELSSEQKTRVYDYNYDQSSIFVGLIVVGFTILVITYLGEF